MSKTFRITFDNRSKHVLLDALKKELTIAEFAIRGGDYSDKALIHHEEVLQLIRGVLYSKPTEDPSTGEETDAQ